MSTSNNSFNFFSNFMKKNQENKEIIIYFSIILILSVISFSYYIQNNDCFLYNDPRRIISGLFFVSLAFLIGLVSIYYGFSEAINEINLSIDSGEDYVPTTMSGAIIYVFWVMVQIVLLLVLSFGVFYPQISFLTMTENKFNEAEPLYKSYSSVISFILILLSIRMLDKNITIL